MSEEVIGKKIIDNMVKSSEEEVNNTENAPQENLKKNNFIKNSEEENKSEESNPKNRWKDNLVKLIKLAVGLGMLAFVIHSTKLDSPEEIKKVLLTDPTKLLTAFIFVLIAQFLGIKRWQILAQFVKIQVSFFHVTKLHFLGLFCNNLLTAVGGDVVKAVYLTNKERKYESLLSVVLDRYVGLLVILIVASIAAFSLPSDNFHRNLAYTTWGILLALITSGVTALLFSDIFARSMERFKGLLEKYKKEHWPNKIRDLRDLTKMFLKNYYVVGTSLLLSVISQCFAILSVHQLSLGVGAEVDASTMFVIVPIVLLISVIPISPGGLGTREAAFTYLLTNAYVTFGIEENFSKSAAALVAILWLAINLLISLPGAVSYYSTVGNNKK